MRLWHLQNQALQNLLLVTSPWCFFLAHPFLLLKSLIISFESARPPAFKCGNLFKCHVEILQLTCFSTCSCSSTSSCSWSLKIRALKKNNTRFHQEDLENVVPPKKRLVPLCSLSLAKSLSWLLRCQKKVQFHWLVFVGDLKRTSFHGIISHL